MSAIAGACGDRIGDAGALLDRMVESLCYVDEPRVDRFAGERVVLARIDPGIANPQPQPATSADGARRLVFAGELFEADALRAELASQGRRLAPDGGDAELALALFEERGEEGLAALNGSFAFALHDDRAKELVLVSDRFSSRPLFHALGARGTFVFATQVATVLQCPEVARDLDERGVREFFSFQRVLGTRTLARAVSMLAPATVLRLRDGVVSLSSYWQMEYRPEKRPESEWVEAMAEAFRRSTARAIRGEHRFGVLLSGGLDARMVVAASERPLTCFHFNDSHNQEFEKARKIAEARGFAIDYLQRPRDHYTRLFERAVDIGSGLYAFNHGHTIGLVSGVRDRCDVMLHGFAPELYFRGTNLPHRERSFLGQRWMTIVDPDLSADNVAAKIVSKLKYSLDGDRPAQLFAPGWKKGQDDALLASAHEQIAEAAQHSDDVYDQFLWADTWYHCKFPSFLFEASIRPFLTERSIVFDNDVLDLHLRMPVERRADDRVWNRAMACLSPAVAAVPNANTGHSLFLPKPVEVALDTLAWAQRRTGLSRPPEREPGHATGSWPKFSEQILHDDRLRELIAGTIEDPEAIDPEIFDVPRLRAMLSEHLEGRADRRKILFLLATFGSWHRRYGPPGRALSA